MTTSSLWVELDLERKIVGLLAEQVSTNVGSDFGRPFVTAYQLAIMFAERYPSDYEVFVNRGFPIGGLNSGSRTSLPQYLAGQLSDKARSQSVGIEGGFLSCKHLSGFIYDCDLVEPSVPQVAMFRIK